MTAISRPGVTGESVNFSGAAGAGSWKDQGIDLTIASKALEREVLLEGLQVIESRKSAAAATAWTDLCTRSPMAKEA